MAHLIGFRSRLLQQEDLLAQLHEFPHCRNGEIFTAHNVVVSRESLVSVSGI